MDGNSRERGRHRRRAHTDHSSTVGTPQWTATPSDRPEWTPAEAEPKSWFQKQEPGSPDGSRWRPADELTDTAWGLDGAWRDPGAAWNVAGSTDTALTDTFAGQPLRAERAP